MACPSSQFWRNPKWRGCRVLLKCLVLCHLEPAQLLVGLDPSAAVLPPPMGGSAAASVAALFVLRIVVPSSSVFARRPSVSGVHENCLGASLHVWSFLLHVNHRGGCTQRDAPPTPFSCLHLYFVNLKASMPCETPLWRLWVSCPSLPFIFRLWASVNGNAPVRCVPFVDMKQQLSPDSSIWANIGTNYGAEISKIASHASSIELIFALPCAR